MAKSSDKTIKRQQCFNNADISKSEDVENKQILLRPKELFKQLHFFAEGLIMDSSPWSVNVKESICHHLVQIIRQSTMKNEQDVCAKLILWPVEAPRTFCVFIYFCRLGWCTYHDGCSLVA